MLNAPVLVRRVLRAARDAHEADQATRRTARIPETDPTDTAARRAISEIRVIPGVRSRTFERMATPKPGPRMMARPAPRSRPMATPFASDEPGRDLGRPGHGERAALLTHEPTRAAVWRMHTGRGWARRSMARCPAEDAKLETPDTRQILRPRISMLAADRRGAPVLVLAVLLLTSLAAALPGGTGRASTDGTGGTGSAYPRVAALGVDPQLAAGFVGQVTRAAAGERPDLLEAEQAAAGQGLVTGEQSPAGAAFATDGTLIKPFAIDTEVPTISDRVRTYRVRQGDSLTGIAHRFGLQMMTLWWANKLSGKDELHIGQELIIPPADGILYTVKDGDTLETLARKYEVPPESIVKYNEIEGTTLIIGQQLLLPGGEGAPIHVARERARSAAAPARTSRSSTAPGTNRGGALGWPVPSGHISQYFHYGHYAIDVAASYGAPVVAAGSGRVVFAGWRNNGGGYQVWISHGRNKYTTYNHMSSVSVGSGATVSRGQQVGRIGATGWATGPHLHFEVWIGPIWSGGYRVNPLNYL